MTLKALNSVSKNLSEQAGVTSSILKYLSVRSRVFFHNQPLALTPP